MYFSCHLLTLDLLLFFLIANKQFTILNFNLLNRKDLNRILQSKIFLHKDGKLRAAHVILEYTPISSSFQSPKHIIKAKDLWLLQINVVVLDNVNTVSDPVLVCSLEQNISVLAYFDILFQGVRSYVIL